MTRRKTGWILLILAAAVMYLFDNGTETLVLLIALIAAPVISLGLLKISGKHISVTVEKADPVPDSSMNIRLCMASSDVIPVSQIEADVVCTNLRTGEEEIITISRPLGPKGKTEALFEVTPDHAGRYRIAVDSAKIYDPLKLWAREITAEGSEFITVMPELFDIDLQVTSSALSMLESDRYNEGKSGNDPGDVRSIREYVPGDPVKNIHWKLSDKTDKMLVKELGLPVTDQFLVVLDNAAEVGLVPEALDAIVSVFASVLTSLCNEGFVFTAGWTDPDSGIPVLRTIRNEEELIAAADEYLAVPAIAKSAFESISRDIIDSRFAHLILAGSRIPDGIDAITNGCQVTLLMYGADSYGKTDSGSAIIGFNESTYTSDLAGIEV